MRIIYYKLDGTVDHTEKLIDENLGHILGMKSKFTYTDGNEIIGYASCNENYYKNGQKEYMPYIEVWTLENFNEDKPNDLYNQVFTKVDMDNVVKIESILHSNPRWGTTPSNKFEFTKPKRFENDNQDDLDIPPFLKGTKYDSSNDYGKAKLIYVEYLDSLGDRMYCYTSTDNYDKDDIVVVPRGYNDIEVFAKVITTKLYDYNESPYPVEKLKEIHFKVDKSLINIEDYQDDCTVDYDIFENIEN